MSDSKTTAEVLEGLAAKLPEEALTACFPDQAPAALRAVLREAAQMIAQLDRRQVTERRQAARTAGDGKPARMAPGAKLILYTDGAARGNPGPAGAGILLLDDAGREIAAKGVYLGECTNNVAEYRALILGLQEARRYNPGELSVYLDSELIVKQLLGSYQVKDLKLKPLHAEAAALLQGLGCYQIVHVPRRENQRADQLANQGIDAGGHLSGRH